tara:strand:+ start:526 stop:1599 length:1074 start_codon:yes stop_codon:yes gene_type:complete
MLKVYILLAISLILTLLSKTQAQDFSFKEEYSIAQPSELKILTNDGNIQIMPSTGNKVEVYYIVKKDMRIIDINRAELEEKLILEVEKNQNSLEIKVTQKNGFSNWRNRMYVSFKVLVPKQTSCELQSSDGNIHIEGLIGNQDLKTSDGNIHIRNIVGNVDGRTSDGNIDIEQVQGSNSLVTSDGNIQIRKITGQITGRTSDGNIDISTVNGNVRMVTSDGNIVGANIQGDLELTTSDGDIHSTNTNGNTNLKTSDGNVLFEDLSGSLKATTSDGDIRGNINELKNKLELRTNDGNIDVSVPDGQGLNLALKGEKIRTELKKFDGTSKDNSVTGKINGGGIPVELVANDGNVTLLYK